MHVLIVQPQLDLVVRDPAGRSAWRRRLEAAVPDADFEYLESQTELEGRIADADVVAGYVSPEVLAKAGPRLKLVHSWAAGPDKQLYEAFIASDIALSCCKGNGAIPLAEHAVMLMLMLQRDAVGWLNDQRAHKWNHRPHPELNGKVCAIIGTGYSGTDLAIKLKAFHMRVTGLRRTPAPAPHFDQMYTRDQMSAFLGEADFIVVTAPRTPETIGLLGVKEFAMMKPSAYYICFSRGGIADDDALLASLLERRIAGAGLDAHGAEPLPPDSPFWDAPNTIVTPHNGATTPDTHQRGLDMLIENLHRHAAGKPLLNAVEKRAGY